MLPKGYKMSPEAIAKRSAKRRGKKQSPETIAKRKATFAKKEVKQKMRDAKIGKTLTPEHKEKIAQANIGREVSEKTRNKISNANKGRTRNEETRRQASERTKSLWSNPDYRTQVLASRVGKYQDRTGIKASGATKEKLRISHLGKKRTIESRLKQGKSIAGSNHHSWRGGIGRKTYRGIGWYVDRCATRARANGKCELCGGVNIHGWQLDVHHIVPYREIPVNADWACLALCRGCHVKVERGFIDTTELQDALRPRLLAMLQCK